MGNHYNGNHNASAKEGSVLRRQSAGLCTERRNDGTTTPHHPPKKSGKNVKRLLRDSPLVRWVLQRLRALREQGRKSCSVSATGQEERRKEGK